MRSRGLGLVADPWGLGSGSWSRWNGEPRQAVGGLGAGDWVPTQQHLLAFWNSL